MSFDRIAPHYEWMERAAFGQTLQGARTTWLRKIEAPSRALIVGEGDGRFLCALLAKFPELNVDCVDASVRMLQLALERIDRELPGSESRVRFFQEDLRDWLPNESTYDLIVTHFVLDCFNEPELSPIVKKLARSALPGAWWLLADFSISQGPVARLHARVWLGAMYLFFWAVAGISARRLINTTPLLQRNGFHRLHRRHWRGGLVKSEVWRRG